MIELLIDQNFNEDILDGLTRRDAALEFTLVRDVGLEAAPDATVLEWAAARGLVLLTHDRKTIPPVAYARVAAGLPMPGVFLVSNLGEGRGAAEVTTRPLYLMDTHALYWRRLGHTGDS